MYLCYNKYKGKSINLNKLYLKINKYVKQLNNNSFYIIYSFITF